MCPDQQCCPDQSVLITGVLTHQMETLCVDKELLVCRNRSLTAELHKRGSSSSTTTSLNGAPPTEGGGIPSWLISNSSEYEVMAI